MRAWLFGLLLAAAPVGTGLDVGLSRANLGLCTREPRGAAAPPSIEAVGILPGFGTGGFPIRTSTPEAQAWFDYGMRLAHAFNHEEATAAFRRAERLDPSCAMCAWGEGFSLGPTINFGKSVEEIKAARAVADKAVVLAEGGPERERLLALALQQRYAPAKTSGDQTGMGDKAWASALDGLTRRYPDDSEIAILAADAQLIKGALWKDKSGYPRAMAVLEEVLRRHPEDTGAIHFYIHASEASGEPAKAEAFANRLGELAPGAGHLVHMPSHTFFRVGRYEDAALANVRAVEVDHAHRRAVRQPADSFRRSYHGHNVHFGIAGAMMAGDEAAAMTLARHFLSAQADARTDEGWLQISSSSAYYAFAGYAPEPAAVPAPPRGLAFAARAWRYARGEASLRAGHLDGARAELAALASAPADFRAFGQDAKVAGTLDQMMRLTLHGHIAMAAGDFRAAERFFRRAAVAQADLGGRGDPPLFWYPVRRSVASALLARGRYADAVREASASLDDWPRDAVALKVRAAAEAKLGQTAAAARDLAVASGGWKGDLSGIDLRFA